MLLVPPAVKSLPESLLAARVFAIHTCVSEMPARTRCAPEHPPVVIATAEPSRISLTGSRASLLTLGARASSTIFLAR